MRDEFYGALNRALSHVNKKIGEHYGFDAQSNQLIEECAELIQSVNKYKRAIGKGQDTKVKRDEAKTNLIEEIADVEVMLEQIKALLNISDNDIKIIKLNKIERTYKQILKDIKAVSDVCIVIREES